MNIQLLKTLCGIHAPSGSEFLLTEFLLDYIEEHKNSWSKQPIIHQGGEFHDAIVLVFGKPTTAIFAHIDSIGFTVGYGNKLIKIGGPQTENGYKLVGEDSLGPIECELFVENDEISYIFNREIERGTTLTFKPEFKSEEGFVNCCYMDNRLGILNALEVAKTLENGIICFSCYEEQGGGSAQFLGKFIYDKYMVRQALISDITWVTSGVQHGNGVAISMRDSGIPRRRYLNRIIDIAKASKVDYQLEVESAGGSDGNVLHRSPYPFDWCFIGAAEDNVHSPYEKVAIKDFESMVELYKALMVSL